MYDLNDLSYFVHVVDHNGIAAASRALGIPKSKLSRRLAALEDRLGVRLVQRSTRHFNVTEVGKSYYQHSKAMLIEADTAEETIAAYRATPKGIIRLSCPVTLLNAHVGKMIADFMALYPDIHIHLDATNRAVDVIAEGIDVAIRVRPAPLENSDLVLRILSDRGQCILAHPKLIDQFGQPNSPEDLGHWPALGLGEPQQSFAWHLVHADKPDAVISFQPKLITRDMTTLKQAVIAGVGIVQLPRLLVRDEIAQQQLISILPDWEPRREIIHLVYPSRRGLLPAIRLFIDHIKQQYQQMHED